eukprot:563774-Hanusia_phi.AAC.1
MRRYEEGKGKEEGRVGEGESGQTNLNLNTDGRVPDCILLSVSSRLTLREFVRGGEQARTPVNVSPTGLAAKFHLLADRVNVMTAVNDRWVPVLSGSARAAHKVLDTQVELAEQVQPFFHAVHLPCPVCLP